MGKQRKIGWQAAMAIVIANMVGTGVFTTLGFQLESVQSIWGILLLWIVGGVISLLGAFSYAEIGTHLPKSGGEYHFLSKTIHPLAGYLSGWVSLTVGFAAPVALAAMAMGAYLDKFVPVSGMAIAITSILLISVVHSINLKNSSLFQGTFTWLKVLLIIGMILAGLLYFPNSTPVEWSPNWSSEIFTPSFAIALIYVTYAYSGWNASAYIVGEIKNPNRNLPISLVGGTLLVSVLYVLLQLTFLQQAPIQELASKVEVGQVAAEYMFGQEAGKWVSFLIGFLLISSISAMIWVGPRISRAMADDYPIWHFLKRDNQAGIPVRAIWFQAALSILMIISGRFEQILLYSGFILQIFTTLTVSTLFILRQKKTPHNYYRSPFYPVLQIIFISISIWMIVYMIADKPNESLWGLINLGIGLVTYFISKKMTSYTMDSNQAASGVEKTIGTSSSVSLSIPKRKRHHSKDVSKA